MIYQIPGTGEVELKTIILDLNGTLSVAGNIVNGAATRVQQLKTLGYRIILFTGNTRGDADTIAADLGIEWKLAKNAAGKRESVMGLDPETCVSIGNGRIDFELMKAVKLRIVTLQAEGVHVQTLLNSDVVVPSINDALDLLIDSQSLIATLRS